MLLLAMPLVAATSLDVLSHEVPSVQCWREPLKKRVARCNNHHWPRSSNAQMLFRKDTVAHGAIS